MNLLEGLAHTTIVQANFSSAIPSSPRAFKEQHQNEVLFAQHSPERHFVADLQSSKNPGLAGNLEKKGVDAYVQTTNTVVK
jgi:hypothetical protein